MKSLSVIVCSLALVWMLGVVPAQAGDAAALYKSKCAMCHGADGSASGAMAKKLGMKAFSSPEVSKMKDTELFEIIKNGKNKMPGNNNKLSDDQIKSLVKYIRSLK